MNKLGSVVLVALLANGCATAGPRYQSSLTGVQRPADVQERWGEYVIAPADAGGHSYEDDLVEVSTGLTGGGVWLAIENKTEHTMQVIWDEAAFVVEGESGRVLNGELSYADMNRSQTPTVIPGNSFVDLFAVPRSNVDMQNYRVVDFVPPGAALSRTVEVRLMLPLRVQDVENSYTFVYEVSPPEPTP